MSLGRVREETIERMVSEKAMSVAVGIAHPPIVDGDDKFINMNMITGSTTPPMAPKIGATALRGFFKNPVAISWRRSRPIMKKNRVSKPSWLHSETVISRWGRGNLMRNSAIAR
ncbi:hypothetical protein BPY_22670 [Bifidobacterium psychraerophilum]